MAPKNKKKSAAATAVDMDSTEMVDNVCDQLVDLLEKAQSKNARARLEGVKKLNELLASKPAPEFIAKNQETLLFLAGRPTNKSDKEAEQHVILLGLVAIQAGTEVSSLIVEPVEQLRVILKDSSKAKILRTACAVSLAIINRICLEEPEEMEENARALKMAWAETTVAKEDSIRLVSSALASWCVVVLDGNSRIIREAQEVQPQIFDLLSSPHLEIRLAAAEALAFFHEFLLDARPGFRFSNQEDVIDKLHELAENFSKRTAKSDRRIQRAAIRDIVDYMENEGEMEEEVVKVGGQTLSLDTFGHRIFYSTLCDLLGGGISRHLMLNEVLREVFELGEIGVQVEKGDKKKELAYHHAAEKYRDLGRGKDRDCRSKIEMEEDEGCY